METNSLPGFEADIELMANSTSPVAQKLASFLNDVVMLAGIEQLHKCVVTSLETIYREAFSTARIVALGKEGVGRVGVILTRKRAFYVIYYPTSGEQDTIAKIYQGFTVPFPERFHPDTRSLVLEINLDGEIAAKPVVLIEDDEQPMTRGLITYQQFSSVHPELVTGMVENIKAALSGDSFKINDKPFVRPKTPIQPQSF